MVPGQRWHRVNAIILFILCKRGASKPFKIKWPLLGPGATWVGTRYTTWLLKLPNWYKWSLRNTHLVGLIFGALLRRRQWPPGLWLGLLGDQVGGIDAPRGRRHAVVLRDAGRDECAHVRRRVLARVDDVRLLLLGGLLRRRCVLLSGRIVLGQELLLLGRKRERRLGQRLAVGGARYGRAGRWQARVRSE